MIGQLDATTTIQQIASDGTNVYVARPSHSDVVRVDSAGNVAPVVTAQVVTALVVDVTSGNLYYGTSTGAVGRAKSDGSASPMTLGTSINPIAALDLDDASVYMLTGVSASDVLKVAK